MRMLEIIGVLVGIIYLYWEYFASRWLWIASIIMSSLYIIVYAQSGFYADMGINIYYLLASLYGFIRWRSNSSEKKSSPQIRHLPITLYAYLTSLTIALWAAIFLILKYFTDSSVALGDSLTTALSVVALWALTQKYVEQWIIWIIVNLVSTYLYITKGLLPTASLYAIYTIIAGFGYFKWHKMAKINYS
ncbi:MAG: nicotinamide riboside transporter PnuC [Bacteroidales bacterium]